MEPELHAYLGGLTRELKGKTFAIGGAPDHVHLLIALPPTVPISDALRFIKANSSGWVHDKWPKRASFAWQLGFGAFGVSRSNAPQVIKYIENQKAHHRRVTFQEEFLDFLRKHQIEYDERYLWV
jgi:putative transposase